MPTVQKRCPSCEARGYTEWNCQRCSGTGHVSGYEMSAGPLRSFLRIIVVFGFFGLVFVYVGNIWSKMDRNRPDTAFHDPFRHLEGGRRGIVRPLGDESDPFDVPSQCNPATPQAGLCAAVMQEIKSGKYFILKCSYWPALSPKEKGTVHYQFWYKITPPNLVQAAQAGFSDVEIRALGKAAVDGCPASETEARDFLVQNGGIVSRIAAP